MMAEKRQELPEGSLSYELLRAYIQEDRDWKRSIETRVTDLESGKPIEVDMQTRFLIILVFALIIALAWALSEKARGGDITALLPIAQWLTAIYQHLRVTLPWI